MRQARALLRVLANNLKILAETRELSGKGWLERLTRHPRIVVIALASLLISSSQMFLVNTAGAEAKMPTATIGAGNVVTLEVASTEKEIEHGLMERTSLPENQGMIFLFRPPREVNFWMYNCYISLDMLFVRDGRIVHIFEDVPPCRSKDPRNCPTYPEGQGMLVSEVIELKGGYAKRHSLKVGDKVSFDVIPPTKHTQDKQDK